MSKHDTSTHLTQAITGAASGFGLATVRKFIDEGAKVVAADMNEPGLQKAYADAADSHVAVVTANVTSSSDWSKLVDLAVSKFGGLDILVNNAGTSYKNKPTLEVTEEEFDKVFAVNVRSIFLSISAAVPALQKRGGGAIINIASIGAMRPRPGLVWYNASKGAVANVRSAHSTCRLKLQLTLMPGNEGSRRRVRQRPNPSKRVVPLTFWDRPVRELRRRALQRREHEEIPV